MLTLQAASYDWALEHALKHGDTDVFPLPFEFEAIKHDWVNVRNWLLTCDVRAWTVRPHRTLLAPKARYGFRVVTQLDPLDFLVFAATIYEFGREIEQRRIPPDQNIVFSYRFDPRPDGQIFDPFVGYSAFQQQTKEILQEEEITYVAITDIADFYSRIYHHRLEGALESASPHVNHIKTVMHLLKGWNGTETFGIPVGSAPARLLAEATVSDVDDALLANGVRFVRYNDDYRIFAKSHAEGYRHLAFLADILFRNHGLTLQPQKTLVLPKLEFSDRFLPDPEDREIDSLRERFEQLVADLDLADRYESIDYDDLEDEQRELVDSLNLGELFREEIEADRDPDLGVIRFVLRRMSQLSDAALVDDVLDNLDLLHPLFPDVIEYLRSLRGLTTVDRNAIGAQILDLLEDSIVSELDYHRMWALDLFTRSTEWDNENRFFALLGDAKDLMSRRKLILAMGRSSQRHWFQAHWRRLFDETPWPRRAFLAAASCMPPDARRHWYRSVEARLDPLELAVMRWARQNPFG